MARDFKEFIRLTGTTHVRTSPYYPQSNGKLERWHGTLKRERFRQAAPGTLDEARRVVGSFVRHYNDVRLHSALGYLTPADKLAGLEAVIFAERDRKLEAARMLRRPLSAAAQPATLSTACVTAYRERLAGVQGAGNEAPLVRAIAPYWVICHDWAIAIFAVGWGAVRVEKVAAGRVAGLEASSAKNARRC